MYAIAKIVASRPNARGAANDAMTIAAMAANITSRTPPSSGSSVFVSHAYADHAHHKTLSNKPARSMPRHVGSSISKGADLREGKDEDEVEEQLERDHDLASAGFDGFTRSPLHSSVPTLLYLTDE